MKKYLFFLDESMAEDLGWELNIDDYPKIEWNYDNIPRYKEKIIITDDKTYPIYDMFKKVTKGKAFPFKECRGGFHTLIVRDVWYYPDGFLDSGEFTVLIIVAPHDYFEVYKDD